MNPAPPPPDQPLLDRPGSAHSSGSKPLDLASLFDRHADSLYRAAHRVVGNGADAQDVVQTVFLRLLRRQDPLDLSKTAASYLHRAAVNAGLDMLRSRKRARAVPIPEGGEGELVESHPDVSAERRVERSELQDALRQAVSGLSPRAAEIFALRYFSELGNREIAKLLGTTRSSIAVTLHRSRERLKQELDCVAGEKR